MKVKIQKVASWRMQVYIAKYHKQVIHLVFFLLLTSVQTYEAKDHKVLKYLCLHPTSRVADPDGIYPDPDPCLGKTSDVKN